MVESWTWSVQKASDEDKEWMREMGQSLQIGNESRSERGRYKESEVLQDRWYQGCWSLEPGPQKRPTNMLYIWSDCCLICKASLPQDPPLYTLLPYTYTHINKHAHTHHSIPSTHQSSSTARILTAATSASRLHHCFTFTLPSLILSELGASEHVSGDQPANTGQLVCRMKYYSFFSEERRRGGIWSREKDYRNVKIDRKGVFKYILAF